MAGTKEYTKDDLAAMAAHVSNKDVSSYTRSELLPFVKEAVMKLKPRVSKVTFPAIVTFGAVKDAMVDAGLQLLSYAGSKVVFGIPSGKKTGIKLVSVTDASKKNRRKLAVHFGSFEIQSDVFELENVDKGTRSCGSQSQSIVVIDNAVLGELKIDEIKAEITRLAKLTRENRYASMKQAAAEKATSKVDAKFSS